MSYLSSEAPKDQMQCSSDPEDYRIRQRLHAIGVQDEVWVERDIDKLLWEIDRLKTKLTEAQGQVASAQRWIGKHMLGLNS